MGGAVIVHGAECQDKRQGNVARRNAESVKTTTRQCNTPKCRKCSCAADLYAAEAHTSMERPQKNTDQEAESTEKKQEVCADMNGRKEKE
jgi:hypothetical protein